MRNNANKLNPRIVASLGNSALEDIRAIKGADLIELRLDLIDGDPIKTLSDLRNATHLPIIATNRLNSEGGQFAGSEEERLFILQEASDYVDYIDIEFNTESRDDLLRDISKPIIISYHDFSCTPSKQELISILNEMSKTRAKIAKIAVTPMSLKDNLLVLEFLLEADANLCMIAMGKLGRHLRVISPFYGSVLTYGFVSRPTAPGQMSVSELSQAIRLLSSE
ncbi:MAG: type I 3-dehydroquinate dehydratase [Methanotrichaceae archaeon]|nr:type I 3-dehydroquinate dehydratase [Methanotrichaceae archaeon]